MDKKEMERVENSKRKVEIGSQRANLISDRPNKLYERRQIVSNTRAKAEQKLKVHILLVKNL